MESQSAWTMRWSIALACLALPIGVLGCGGESAGDSSRGFRVEGTEPGDCEDGADNDADGLFDCADTSCAASPLCTDGGAGGASGTSGAGGGSGTAGTGGAGGSMLCSGVDCDDQNECTEDACDPMNGTCGHTNVTEGISCDFGGLPGVCGAGVCEDAMLCSGVDCDDQNECTLDACDPLDGLCDFTATTDGSLCDFGGLPGVCASGACRGLCTGVICNDANQCTEDACNPLNGRCEYTGSSDGVSCDYNGFPGTCQAASCQSLCFGVVCGDGDACTEDTCNPLDGACEYPDAANGTACSAAGSPGACTDGVCVPATCITNALCSSCPDTFLCDDDNDCFAGWSCIPSGCETIQGGAIKQCQPNYGGACASDTDCPSPGYSCMTVPLVGNRCVKQTPGCNSDDDCVAGFSCESGACVDRRVACDLDADCPVNHSCQMPTANNRFCMRIHRTCQQDVDCGALAPYCVDVDGDGNKECAGTFNPNDPFSAACTNAQCGDQAAPVCEASGAGSTTQCGQYGLCVDGGDCAAGFTCAALWPDGRKECVQAGGECSSFADCPVRQLCASPREGGAPSCQVGAADAQCQSSSITPSRAIPNIMLLVDQSGSMTQDFGGGQNRWEATHSAITSVISHLEAIVRFGLTTYQSADGGSTPDQCPIFDTQIDFAMDNFATINMSFPASFPGGEDTPTGDSIDVLVSIIQADPPPAEGPTIIVLATDGEPDTCEFPDPQNGQAESVAAATAAHSAGIDLFVLSVGTDVSGAHLQEMANVGAGLPGDGSGGDAPFWVSTDPAQLENAFLDIITSSISCDVQMDQRFDDKAKACNEGDVRLNSTPLDCPTEWRVKPGVDDVIELVGSACDTFKSGNVTFSATFPCGAIVVD